MHPAISSLSSSVMNLSKYPEAEVSACCILWIECSRQVNRKTERKKKKKKTKILIFRKIKQIHLKFMYNVLCVCVCWSSSPLPLVCFSTSQRVGKHCVACILHAPEIYMMVEGMMMCGILYSKIISKHRLLEFVVFADILAFLCSHIPHPIMIEWSVFSIHSQLSIDVEHKMKLHITQTSHRLSAFLSIVFLRFL